MGLGIVRCQSEGFAKFLNGGSQVILSDSVNTNTYREGCRLTIGFFLVQTLGFGKGLSCRSGFVLLLQNLSQAQVGIRRLGLILNGLSKFKNGAAGISLLSEDGA